MRLRFSPFSNLPSCFLLALIILETDFVYAVFDLPDSDRLILLRLIKEQREAKEKLSASFNNATNIIEASVPDDSSFDHYQSRTNFKRHADNAAGVDVGRVSSGIIRNISFEFLDSVETSLPEESSTFTDSSSSSISVDDVGNIRYDISSALVASYRAVHYPAMPNHKLRIFMLELILFILRNADSKDDNKRLLLISKVACLMVMTGSAIRLENIFGEEQVNYWRDELIGFYENPKSRHEISMVDYEALQDLHKFIGSSKSDARFALHGPTVLADRNFYLKNELMVSWIPLACERDIILAWTTATGEGSYSNTKMSFLKTYDEIYRLWAFSSISMPSRVSNQLLLLLSKTEDRGVAVHNFSYNDFVQHRRDLVKIRYSALRGGITEIPYSDTFSSVNIDGSSFESSSGIDPWELVVS
jgi:hypothetical protein